MTEGHTGPADMARLLPAGQPAALSASMRETRSPRSFSVEVERGSRVERRLESRPERELEVRAKAERWKKPLTLIMPVRLTEPSPRADTGGSRVE